jgi:hypothetical protein
MACAHYLPANRFDWWQIQERGRVPSTGPVGLVGTSAGDIADIFYSEFCSPLSTVVGADLNLVASVGAGRAIPWEGLFNGDSPNSLPTIECCFRVIRPRSIPVIREVDVNIGPASGGRRKIVVNGIEDGQELNGSRPRPSLFIDFFCHSGLLDSSAGS